MKFRRLVDQVLQTEVDGGLALLDPNTNTYFLLNQTGALVWRALEEEASIDEICAAVAGRFDVTKDHCRDDVTDLLNSMALKGLIVPSHEGSV